MLRPLKPSVYSLRLFACMLFFQDAADAVTGYATERGGDARRLVVARARVRALAEKWGIGRLLEPAAIRALLNQKAGDGGQSSAGVTPQ